jgi:hypothetical protein
VAIENTLVAMVNQIKSLKAPLPPNLPSGKQAKEGCDLKVPQNTLCLRQAVSYRDATRTPTGSQRYGGFRLP